MYFLQAAAWCFLSMTLVSVTALIHRMSLEKQVTHTATYIFSG